MGEELSDFRDAHVFRVTFPMVENIVLYPEHISIFGTRRIAFNAQGIAILVEKFFTSRGYFPFGG